MHNRVFPKCFWIHKIYLSISKGLRPAISCVRDQDATRFPEFAEITEFHESSAPFRKNSTRNDKIASLLLKLQEGNVFTDVCPSIILSTERTRHGQWAGGTHFKNHFTSWCHHLVWTFLNFKYIYRPQGKVMFLHLSVILFTGGVRTREGCVCLLGRCLLEWMCVPARGYAH